MRQGSKVLILPKMKANLPSFFYVSLPVNLFVIGGGFLNDNLIFAPEN